MSSLTRWVLAHKRTVVLAWVALTIAGMAAAGPATDALENEFSVPDKEGWETNELIAEKYNGTGGDTSPLLPVVTLPQGESWTWHITCVRDSRERDLDALREATKTLELPYSWHVDPVSYLQLNGDAYEELASWHLGDATASK